jgi:hypothetical protein
MGCVMGRWRWLFLVILFFELSFDGENWEILANQISVKQTVFKE